MKNLMMGIVMAMIILSVAGGVSAQDKQPQTTCPVTGGNIDKNVYTDFQGQRIYFCCAECVATFKADPEKYMAKFAEEGVLLECVQEACPVMGGKIRKDVFVDYKGRRVYFCCPGCVGKFEADPGTYLKKLEKNPSIKGEDHGSLQHRMNSRRGWWGCSWDGGKGPGCCWTGDYNNDGNSGGCCR